MGFGAPFGISIKACWCSVGNVEMNPERKPPVGSLTRVISIHFLFPAYRTSKKNKKDRSPSGLGTVTEGQAKPQLARLQHIIHDLQALRGGDGLNVGLPSRQADRCVCVCVCVCVAPGDSDGSARGPPFSGASKQVAWEPLLHRSEWGRVWGLFGRLGKGMASRLLPSVAQNSPHPKATLKPLKITEKTSRRHESTPSRPKPAQTSEKMGQPQVPPTRL